MKTQIRHIISELRAHLPYSIFSVAAGIIILGFLTFVAQIFGSSDVSNSSRSLFHLFHPVHVLFSATATTAMFWRHEKRPIKAIIVGFLGSIGLCGISDVFIPFLSGYLLGVEMDLHICVVEHPAVVIPFLATGIIAGLVVPNRTQKSTIFSHTGHVFVSSMASILYLAGYGLTDWIHLVGLVFVYMVLAVLIPCCTSDIIFPLLLTKNVDT